MKRDVLKELAEVRAYQRSQWGDEHDDQHRLYDWTTFMAKYLGRVAQIGMRGTEPPPEGQSFTQDEWQYLQEIQARRSLLDLAAIAVAAVEALDRRSTNSSGNIITRSPTDHVLAPGTDEQGSSE